MRVETRRFFPVACLSTTALRPPLEAGALRRPWRRHARIVQIERLPARRVTGQPQRGPGRSGDNPSVIDNRSIYRSFLRYNLIDK